MNEVKQMAIVEKIKTNEDNNDYQMMILRRTNILLQRFPTANWEQIYDRISNASNVDDEFNAIYANCEHEEETKKNKIEITTPDAIAVKKTVEKTDKQLMVILRRTNSVLQRFPTANWEHIYDRLLNAIDIDSEANAIADQLEIDTPGSSKQTSPSLIKQQCQPDDVDLAPEIREKASFLTDDEKKVFKHVCQIFTDADPFHIIDLITSENIREIDTISEHMIEKGYQKLKPRQDRERRACRRKIFLSTKMFQIDDFLAIYPDPMSYFSEQRQSSNAYINHAIIFLMNYFKDMRREYIVKILTQNNNRLLPTYRFIKNEKAIDIATNDSKKNSRKRSRINKTKYLISCRTEDLDYPDELDEQFFREAQYSLNEEKVVETLAKRKVDYDRKIAEARLSGQLVECPICLNDEVLAEDISSCDQRLHRFCNDCVKNYATTQIADGAHIVHCMDDDCKSGRISLRVLRKILDGRILQQLVQRSQLEEIRAANLGNMDTCPFCDFSMIIDNPDERLFQCRNSECLRESCRECRQSSHIPLRCDEAANDDVETKMRVYVENEMAAAMIRKCPKCEKPIIKEDGCNKMVCPCGTYFCYVCNAQLPKNNPYSHFGPNKCAQATTTKQLHDAVAKRAGEEAKRRFMSENALANRIQRPDVVDINSLIGSTSKSATVKRRRKTKP